MPTLLTSHTTVEFIALIPLTGIVLVELDGRECNYTIDGIDFLLALLDEDSPSYKQAVEAKDALDWDAQMDGEA